MFRSYHGLLSFVSNHQPALFVDSGGYLMAKNWLAMIDMLPVMMVVKQLINVDGQYGNGCKVYKFVDQPINFAYIYQNKQFP